MQRLMIVSCLWLLALPSGLEGQFSMKPRPLPAARTFLVPEIGYGFRVNEYGANTFNLKRRHYFISEIALMANTGASFAVGPGTFIGMDEGGEFRAGIKLHVQRWLTPTVSVDVAPGVLFADSRGRVEMPGFMASSTLRVTEWVGLTSQFEISRPGSDRSTDYAFYLGAKLGSVPALIANALGAVVAVVGGVLILTGTEG